MLYDISYMQNLKKKRIQMNLYIKEKQSHIYRKKTWLPQVRGINWETGVDIYTLLYIKCFLDGSDGKKSICLQCWRPGFNPLIRKIPWRWDWQPTPVFLSIPSAKDSGGLQSMGLKKVKHRLSTNTFTFSYIKQMTSKDLLHSTGNSN